VLQVCEMVTDDSFCDRKSDGLVRDDFLFMCLNVLIISFLYLWWWWSDGLYSKRKLDALFVSI